MGTSSIPQPDNSETGLAAHVTATSAVDQPPETLIGQILTRLEQGERASDIRRAVVATGVTDAVFRTVFHEARRRQLGSPVEPRSIGGSLEFGFSFLKQNL